nr:nucleoporin nup84 [Quercus suber]
MEKATSDEIQQRYALALNAILVDLRLLVLHEASQTSLLAVKLDTMACSPVPSLTLLLVSFYLDVHLYSISFSTLEIDQSVVSAGSHRNASLAVSFTRDSVKHASELHASGNMVKLKLSLHLCRAAKPFPQQQGCINGAHHTAIANRRIQCPRPPAHEHQKSRSNDQPSDGDDDDDVARTEPRRKNDDGPAARSRESVDIEQALHPLREVAEKVGTEVEAFAIRLDIFLKDLAGLDDRFDAALDLVAELRNIAQEAAEKLARGNEWVRTEQLRQEFRERAQLSTAEAATTTTTTATSLKKAGSVFGRSDGKVKELRCWQQEADIWELFGIILELHYWSSRRAQEAKLAQRAQVLADMGDPHHYEPECETWKRFLLEDELAMQWSRIKSWLEETVEHQESGIDEIVEELEKKGGGLWSKGWMHTRERIKGEKRVRGWPTGSDPVQPHIRTADNAELLVTSLDPDATSRQGRALEPKDQIFEKNFWIACWEMLRRGKSIKEMSSWCEERGEGWRALVFGMAGDQADALSNSTWRKMCFLASQSGCSSDYEAAVYGLLGGNVSAVRKVARTVDDNLYAHYNAALLRRFEQYLGNKAPDKLSRLQSKRFSGEVEDASQAEDAMTRLLQQLKTQSDVATEAQQPLKLLQGYLLVNEVESMINTTGHYLSDIDKRRTDGENMMVQFTHDPALLDRKEADGQAAVDPQTLRIVAHMAIILQAAFTEADSPLNGEERDAEENVLVAYIQALRAAGERDLIPIYASRLHAGRAIRTMGRVVRDVGQPREQQQMLALMQSYGLNTVQIVQEQMALSLGELLDTTGETVGDKSVKILEDTKELIYPGQRIAVDFLSEDMTPEDLQLSQSLNWFLLLHGNWKHTFEALTMATRKCLISGRFACALEIVRNYPYDTVSMQKSYQSVGKSINLMQQEGPWPVDNEDDSIRLDSMKDQSRVYYELELLVRAIEALSAWVVQERKYTTQRPIPTSVPMPVKQTKEALDRALQPILGGILRNSQDELEATDLAYIRRTYIPEVLIAYNTALHTAGNIYTRDCLLQSMDLSVAIAKEENGLAENIAAAGRMRELMTSFARTSKSMLILAASNKKPWKPKKDREGRHPSLWELGTQAGTLRLEGGADGADS